MKVIWTDLAVEHIEEIHAFIAEDSPDAASRWVAEVVEKAESLLDLPRRGRVVPELGRETVRELLIGNYRVIYRLEDERLFILTVRHGRRLLDEGGF